MQQGRLAGIIQAEEKKLGVFVDKAKRGEDVVDCSVVDQDCQFIKSFAIITYKTARGVESRQIIPSSVLFSLQPLSQPGHMAVVAVDDIGQHATTATASGQKTGQRKDGRSRDRGDETALTPVDDPHSGRRAAANSSEMKGESAVFRDEKRTIRRRG